jgi:hypothetical protein
MGVRKWITPSELRVGDVLPDPHLSGKPGRVLTVVPTWYGCAITYEYDGGKCGSAVWDQDVSSPPAVRPLRAGIEVER